MIKRINIAHCGKYSTPVHNMENKVTLLILNLDGFIQQSVTNAFQLVFSGKVNCKVCCGSA